MHHRLKHPAGHAPLRRELNKDGSVRHRGIKRLSRQNLDPCASSSLHSRGQTQALGATLVGSISLHPPSPHPNRFKVREYPHLRKKSRCTRPLWPTPPRAGPAAYRTSCTRNSLAPASACSTLTPPTRRSRSEGSLSRFEPHAAPRSSCGWPRHHRPPIEHNSEVPDQFQILRANPAPDQHHRVRASGVHRPRQCHPDTCTSVTVRVRRLAFVPIAERVLAGGRAGASVQAPPVLAAGRASRRLRPPTRR